MSDEVDDLLAAIQPVRELLDRMMTLLERLTDRVEVLELEHLHATPPSSPQNTP